MESPSGIDFAIHWKILIRSWWNLRLLFLLWKRGPNRPCKKPRKYLVYRQPRKQRCATACMARVKAARLFWRNLRQSRGAYAIIDCHIRPGRIMGVKYHRRRRERAQPAVSPDRPPRSQKIVGCTIPERHHHQNIGRSFSGNQRRRWINR